MGKSADLKIKVTSDTSQASTGLGGLKNKISDLGNDQGLTNFNKGLLNVVPAVTAVAVGVGKVISATKEWVDLYTIQEQAEVKLQSVLTATGNQIGMTVDELGEYASSLQTTTIYGDEAILGVTQLMVATKSLSADGLKRATESSLDLATAMGTSITSAGQQLARALTDPIGQLTTLRRMNINFTDSEKDKIKALVETNRLQDAQNIILSKVESTYGGIATSVGALDSSKLTQISNVVGDIKEDLGAGLVMSLAPAFEWILDSLYKVENYMSEINGIINGTTSYMSIVKWQEEGMDPASAPALSNSSWDAARDFAESRILSGYSLPKTQRDDRFTPEDFEKINKARSEGDQSGAVELIRQALGTGVYDEAGFLGLGSVSFKEEFLALGVIDAYSKGAAQRPELSPFEPSGSASEVGTSTDDAKIQTVTDFVSANKSASDTAQKQHYQELIDKATEYKDAATATAAEQTALDEMIETWEKKKAAIGATTEEVVSFGEFAKSNSSLSLTAQELEIQSQIDKATELSKSNELSETQKTILDEIIIKLKEQKELLSAPAPTENAVDSFIASNSSYSNTAVVDAIQTQIDYAESLLESSDLTDAQVVKLNEIIIGLKTIKEEALKTDDDNDALISDDTKEVINSTLNAFQNATQLIDQLFTNSINSKKAQLRDLQNTFKITSESAKDTAASQISSLDKQYGEGLISLSQYQEKVEAVYAAKNSTIEESANEEKAKQEEIDNLKQRQFNANKANNLLQAAANGALAITEIWSKHAANPVLAGVLTGLSTAAIGSSIATISSQKYTALATGGHVSSKTHAILGEGGSEEIVLPLQQEIFDKYGLSSKGSNSSAGVINFVINVKGGGDSQSTTKAVYNAIEQAQRTGYLPRWNYAK